MSCSFENIHLVSPSINGYKFDTANRKKAVANIFENVNQDVLLKLFVRSGDMKAMERVRSIYDSQDPEGKAKALMALQVERKDKLFQITGLSRQSMKFR
ncbi:transcriptional and immune response regulator b [Alosa pseudoharengus]|uniref:transcriptional and immune response regulator-like n=1 Tax=Alosa sapidissima TaxID=34773 RepID=UPI001C09B85B|nr:transcriptional and immune response regulator-like [Alosa sapidissima]XP_048115199.1 transcriptional and immune response regulator-like [Alosa alosa]